MLLSLTILVKKIYVVIEALQFLCTGEICTTQLMSCTHLRRSRFSRMH